jgi:7-keto-8-aminopelargonate synthetase-like enzyme
VERTVAADALRAKLLATAATLRAHLAELGVRVEAGLGGPIVPIVVGDNARALRVASELESQGILAQAIRPPTVPEGTARVRLTVSAAWPEGAVPIVAKALARALESDGP